MTHIHVLSAEVRRNERLKWMVMANSRHWWHLWANFWLDIYNSFNSRNKKCQFFCNPPYFYLPTLKTFAPSYTSPDLAQNLLSDRFWTPPLSMKISGGDKWQLIHSFIRNSFVFLFFFVFFCFFFVFWGIRPTQPTPDKLKPTKKICSQLAGTKRTNKIIEKWLKACLTQMVEPLS
jgi:hypothetical protein